MTFPTGTIRLQAAQAIFTGVEISEVKISGDTVGYQAWISDEKILSHKHLTNLCRLLWESQALAEIGKHGE